MRLQSSLIVGCPQRIRPLCASMIFLRRRVQGRRLDELLSFARKARRSFPGRRRPRSTTTRPLRCTAYYAPRDMTTWFCDAYASWKKGRRRKRQRGYSVTIDANSDRSLGGAEDLVDEIRQDAPDGARIAASHGRPRAAISRAPFQMAGCNAN